MCSSRFLNYPWNVFHSLGQYISCLVPMPVPDAASQLTAFPYGSPIPKRAALTDRCFSKAAHMCRCNPSWHQPANPASKNSANFLSHHSNFPDGLDKICCVPNLAWASPSSPVGISLEKLQVRGLFPQWLWQEGLGVPAHCTQAGPAPAGAKASPDFHPPSGALGTVSCCSLAAGGEQRMAGEVCNKIHGMFSNLSF